MSKHIMTLMVFLSFALLDAASAQQWGVGVYGGAQACSSGGGGAPNVPDGVADVDDTIADVKSSMAEANAELREVRLQLREEKRKFESNKSKLGIIHDKIRNHLIDHITNGWGQDTVPDPKTECDPDPATNKLKEGVTKSPVWADYCKRVVPASATNRDDFTFAGYYYDVIKPGLGEVDPQVCSKDYTLNDPKTPAKPLRDNCSNAIKALGPIAKKVRELEQKENDYVNEVAAFKDRLDDLKGERRKAIRDAEKEAREGGGTVAGYCYNCQHPQDKPVSTVAKIGSLALGGLGAYLGYRGAKYATDQNTALGWPTSPYLTVAATLPSVMYGIYGATYGGGSGGCSGMGGPGGMMGPGGLYGSGLYPQVGGAFGYPTDMGGMMGGGMYNPGMGPWGVPGPWGTGAGYPGMGVPMSGGFPIMNAIASGIAGMYQGGGIVPFSPIGGYMTPISGGMPISGMPIQSLPYPMSGNMMSMMMPYQGSIQGNMMNMMMPYQGGIQGGYMSMQYQQQMLQQQQAMMQAYMQQQQQAQQDQMVRSQLVSRLSSQLIQIQTQIQQITYGGYGTGTYGGGATLPYPQTLPYPNTTYTPANYTYSSPTVDPNVPQPSRGGR